MTKIKDRSEFNSKSPVMTFGPDEMVSSWVWQMSNQRFRHLPIVDDSRKLINIM